MKKIARRPFTCLILSAVFLSYLGGCTSLQATKPTTNNETQNTVDSQSKNLRNVKFSLSWLFQGVDAPLIAAIDRGYFADEGLNVNFERGYGSADSINKIAAGQYDIGEGDMYSMSEFNEKNPNDKLVAVAIKYNKSPFAIVSLKKKGITDPKMLDGKELAAPAGDAARRLWPAFAQQVGVKQNSVKWTNVEPKLREALLVQGKFDAISCFTISSLPPLNKLGIGKDELNVFPYSENGLDLYGNAIIARESFVKDNPEVVKGFVKAYIKGLQDTLQDPDGVFAIMSKYSKGGLFDEKVERERLQIALDTLYVSPEVKQIGLGAVESTRLKKTIDKVVEGFGLSNTPTPEEVFNDDFLPPKEERAI